LHFSASSFIQAPLSALLEYSGILRPDPGSGPHQAGGGTGEVSIRIVGADEAGASSERADEVIVEEHQEGPARTVQPAQPAPAASGEGGRESSSPYQRYDIQQVARWVEQILPFSLLLLVVFIRQHLQGRAQLSSFQECKTDRNT
jgi:E3 ubiquitin-protein ligase RNFT1